MSHILAQWFSGEGFMSLGHSFLWVPELLWTYLFADAVASISYFLIAAAILHYVRKRRYPQLNRVLAPFAVFIFAGGLAHLAAIWTIWHPDYWLDAVLRALAAVASVVTAALLWPMILRTVKMPTTFEQHKIIRQLEHEVSERSKAEEALRRSQATLRELAAYQERIREDERKRIAREIHDELGQNLLALRLDISALHARASGRHPRLHERASAALEYIDTTMKAIRGIMNNLRPPVLDLGLTAAIEWQVRQFERRNGVPCELLMNEEGREIPEAQATAVFRILQESLNNVGRHACATQVRVELRIDDRALQFSIKDNGVGMFPGDRRKARRFGLIGIQERVTMLDGELQIESAPGQGTSLRITVPLRVAEEAAVG